MVTVTTAPANRAKLVDVPEQRGGSRFEFRENKTTGDVTIRGYAATFDAYDCYGGPDAGGWVEQLTARSFDKTLAAQPDVMLLINHTGAPLARTKSGTLKLSRDARGLLVEARLDPSDPDVQALVPKMRRGDMDEMSFAFRVKDQEWNDDYTHRTINEVSLQKGDVSVVNYGMNSATRVALSEGTVGALAELSHAQLAELRRLDSSLIERAISNLAQVRAEDSGYTPPSGVRAEAKRALQWIADGKAGGGFTDTGRKRASDLAAGRAVSRETIGRIANYLARHESDKQGAGWSPGDEGYPSAGRVAWAAWGGDPAKTWTAGILKSDKSEEKSMDEDNMDEEEKSATPFVEDDEEDDTEEKADKPNPFADDESGPDDNEDEEDDEKLELARSLRKTLTKAMDLCEDDDVRSLLARAQGQLNLLRGVGNGPTGVDNLLEELRQSAGVPTSATVSEGIEFLRQQGTDPLLWPASFKG